MNIEKVCRAIVTLDTIGRMQGTRPHNVADIIKVAEAAHEVLWEEFLKDFPPTTPQSPRVDSLDVYLEGFLKGQSDLAYVGAPGKRRVFLSEPTFDKAHFFYVAPDFVSSEPEAEKACRELWDLAMDGMYLPGVDPHDLSAACTDHKPVTVEEFIPEGFDGEPGSQQYSLIAPTRLAWTEDDILELEASEALKWLRDFEFTNVYEELQAKRPTVASAEDQAAWVESCQQAVLDGIDEARENFAQTAAPAMNYYYLVPGLTEDDAEKILGLPLAAVTLYPQNETALVLNGGGMDLSDHIMLAHILTGHYPPVHFSLPDFVGTQPSQKMRTLLAAARESIEVEMRQLEYKRSKLLTSATRMIMPR